MRVHPQARRPTTLLVVGLVFALGSLSFEASAQPAQSPRGTSTDAQAEARTAMRDGLASFDAKDYEGALARFRRAMELVPEANLPHRHAARALEALGRWEEAVAEHETYLRIKPDVSDAQAVHDRIASIRQTYLTGTLTLACDPQPNAVIVDGRVVTLGPAQEVQLAKGPHHVRVQATGFVSRELDVVVPAGGSVAPDCTMTRATAQSSSTIPGLGFGPTSGPPQREEPSKPWYGRWYTWVGAGAVVTAVVVGTVLLTGGTNAPPATEGGNRTFP